MSRSIYATPIGWADAFQFAWTATHKRCKKAHAKVFKRNSRWVAEVVYE